MQLIGENGKAMDFVTVQNRPDRVIQAVTHDGYGEPPVLSCHKEGGESRVNVYLVEVIIQLSKGHIQELDLAAQAFLRADAPLCPFFLNGRPLRLREAFQQAVSDIEKGDGSVEVTEYVPYRRQFTAVF